MLRELLYIHSIITSQDHVCLIRTLVPTSGQRASWLHVTRQGRYVKAVHRQAVRVRRALPITGRCCMQPNKVLQPSNILCCAAAKSYQL